MSPQARTFFKSLCIQVGVKPLKLLLWIRTQWASLYKFLDRILSLQKVLWSSNHPGLLTTILQGVDHFILLADASEKVPNLSKDWSYADYQLSKKDWDRLEVTHEVLWVCLVSTIGPFHYLTHIISENVYGRSHQMCNRHSLASKHQRYGTSSPPLNSS